MNYRHQMREKTLRTAAAMLMLPAIMASSGLQAHASALPFCPDNQTPSYQFGFQSLHDLLGAQMGLPNECEHADAKSNDTLQHTSVGLAFYRAATNTPTFTNGWEHWGLTPSGLMYWTGTSIDPPTTQATSEEQVYFQRLATILTAYSDIDARTSNVMFNVFNQNGTPQNGSIAIASLYVRFQTEVLDPLTALGAPSPRLAAAHDELRAAAVAERAALESLNAGLRHVNANELNQGNDQRAIAKQQSSAAFDAWKSLYGDSPVQPGPGQTIN